MAFLYVLLGIIGLTPLVLAHEYGHFLAARAVGIPVETFSFGYGKRLFGFRRGGTDFRVSLVPLGGYCRFRGEKAFQKALEDDADGVETEEGDYYAAPPWKRIVVSLAGPAASLLAAVLAVGTLSLVGFEEAYVEPRIILFSEWSDRGDPYPADEAGLSSGDLILSADGIPMEDFAQFREYVAFRPGRPVSLSVLRDGKAVPVELTPVLDGDQGVAVIGVYQWIDPVIGEVAAGSAGESAGFLPGDRIVAVDGKRTPHSLAVSAAMGALPPPYAVDVERDGRRESLVLDASPGDGAGLSFSLPSRRSERMGFFGSYAHGAAEAGRIFGATVRGVGMLFRGSRIGDVLAGPVRLFRETGSVLASGFGSEGGSDVPMVVEFLSFLSVSLALLNLLPIPILDGGQTILFALEWIRRRAFRPKSVYRYQFVGTMIVLSIAVLATAGDFAHYLAR